MRIGLARADSPAGNGGPPVRGRAAVSAAAGGGQQPSRSTQSSRGVHSAHSVPVAGSNPRAARRQCWPERMW